MNRKLLIFPILFCIGALAIPLYKELSVCNGEEKLYKLEIKGRLVDRYLIKETYTHLIFYTGKYSLEPSYSSYSDELKNTINIGDSLYKIPYNDSCIIFKNNISIGFDTIQNSKTGKYHSSKKIIYGYTECPCEKRKKIHDELNSLRQGSSVNNGSH